MKNFFLLLSVPLTLFLMAMNPSQDPLLFKCLSASDFPCIEREMLLEQNWAQQRNRQNETPLKVAILLKNVTLVTFLLEAGAKAKRKDVLLALSAFHHIGRKELAPKSRAEPMKEKNSELLLAALRDDEPEKSMILVAQVLSFLESRIKLVAGIDWLFQQGQLSKRQTQIILNECFSLFLQGKPLTSAQTASIVYALVHLDFISHLLLRFVIESASCLRAPPPIEANVLARGEAKKIPMAKDFAQAIIEKSRSMFLSFSLPTISQHVQSKDGSRAMNSAIQTLENLDKFVDLSLNIDEEEPLKRRYLFWLAVYDILLRERDFMGAYTIGARLSNPDIQKKINPKIYRELYFNANGFREYRGIINAETEFFIPYHVLLLRDSANIVETPLVIEGKLHQEQLEIFNDFQRSIRRAQQRASMRSYPSTLPLKTLMAKLSISDPRLWGIELVKDFQLLWPPLQQNRRRSLTDYLSLPADRKFVESIVPQ